MYPDADTTLSQLTSFDEHLDWLVPNDMQIPDEDKRIEVGRSIRDIYTGGEDLTDHVGDGVRVSTQTVTNKILQVFVVLERPILHTINNQTCGVLLHLC
jgi:hypothetical protein